MIGLRYCCDCGKELDCSKHKECWSDAGFLEINHGAGVQCRECYSKTHDFCSKCEDKPMDEAWIYCPWCGTKVKR